MSNSQRPNPPAPRPSFEVPDLELEPVPRSLRQAAAAPVPVPVQAHGMAHEPSLGASFDFGDSLAFADFELERTAQPNLALVGESAHDAAPAADAAPSWPTGRAHEAAELKIDPLELAILADYGAPPQTVPLTLAYAYRVFTRQRELKRQLTPIVLECERAQLERETTLAELARAIRPAIEAATEFRRFLAPILELEQRAAQRGQALTAINAQLGAESGPVDAELTQLASQVAVEQRLEREAQQQYDEREANAKRAEAKWKRVQIEMRAVTHVAEQKLGPEGGPFPEPEATQLASLRQRAEALEPEVTLARAEFEPAKQALHRVHARVQALQQRERQISRKKQALSAAYQPQLATRQQGVNETETEQRVALADLARAALAARGTIDISESWLERVRSVSDRADKLIVRAEMQRRAIVAYDAERARQGVRLACTAVGLLLVLFVFKLIF